MIFQDPYSSLNPRHTVGSIIAAPYEVQGIKPPGGVKTAVQETMERVGPEPRALQPLPQRVLRRPAAAHRHRPCRHAAAQGGRVRRAGVGARRVDPGPGHQPARRTSRTSSASPTSSSPTTCRWCARCRTASPSCTSAASSRSPTARRLYAQPLHPVHARAACRRCRCRTRRSRPRASGSCCRATCPARSTCRPAACSTPAASARRTAAGSRSRRSWSSAPGTRSPASSRSPRASATT